MTDLWTLVFAFAILAAVCVTFIVISQRVRRRGGSLVTGMLGATHELLTTERRRAGEVILKERAGERSEEEESGDPEKPEGERE